MNIGFFTDTYFPQVNGVTYTIRAWKEGLEERGHRVHIYYPSGEYKPQKFEHPFRSVGFGFYGGYRVALPLRIPKDVRELDVVHSHGLFGMASLAWRAASKYSKPAIATYHTPGDEYINYLTKNRALSSALKGLYLRWERSLLNSFRLVTTASGVIADRLRSNGVGNIQLLSNGIELGVFRRVDAKEFKRRNNVPPGRVIGFCGRLGYEKHVEDLINASDVFEGTVLIAGKGPAEERYKKLAEGKRNVRFLGFLDRGTLSEFYSALDVFVFPSVAETQGLVALESMACGTPVVGVPVMALKTTIVDGVTGYHYKPADTNDLLSKVELCYRNRGRLSEGCLAEAANNSVERTVDRLEGIYSSLA